MQRIDLPAALVLALMAHPESERQRPGEDLAQSRVVLCLADEVVEHPPEIDPQAA